MIDAHCHLEQKEYDENRDQIIEECKKSLKAIFTCGTNLEEINKTLEIVKKHKNFVFGCIGLHPEYIKEIKESDIEKFFDIAKENKELIVAIGEVGLDYYWIKESYWQEKQKELLVRMIEFSKEIKKPLVIHSRDAYEDVIKILEQEDVKKCLLHLFGGKNLIKRVIENNFYITIGPIILKSNKHKQIAKEMDLNLILTETDSPWNSPETFIKGEKKINFPYNVKFVCEEIAKVRNISFETVDQITTKNALEFFEV